MTGEPQLNDEKAVGETGALVVSTGRCGSTLLSRILATHPDLLSLSEFFTSLRPHETYRFSPVSGGEFWRMLTGGTAMSEALLRNNLRLDEWLDSSNRGIECRERTGIPPLLMMLTYPALSDDPEGLFERTGHVAEQWPIAELGQHCRRLFGWLCRELGRARWVERSGASLRYIEHLISWFPEGRYLYVVRDARDTALSMSRHIGFRMGAIRQYFVHLLGYDPYISPSREGVERLPSNLQELLPERFTAKGYAAFTIPLGAFGSMWSEQTIRGVAFLQGVPLEQLLLVRYEDLIDDPQFALRALLDHLRIDAPGAQWLNEAAQLIRLRSSQGWKEMPRIVRQELDEACAPGMAALQLLDGRLLRVK